MRRNPWAGSTRKATLPADWERLRRAVLARDGHQCVILDEHGFRCPERATDCDHIGDRNIHAMENLRSLCHDHHLQRSSQQGNDAQAALRALRRLPEEPQPGIIKGEPQPREHKGF
jgi:5-methylcytosine-specific restriction endonuclease McrA